MPGNILKDKKLLIFDCDGVLFDSHESNIAYFNECLRLAGLPPVSGEHRDGATYMSLSQLIPLVVTAPEQAARLDEVSRSLEFDPFIPLLFPLFDFSRVLAPLGKGRRLAVASNRGRSLYKLLDHFGLNDYFHFKVSAQEARSKPDPDMLLRCTGHFGMETREAVFLGDSDSDCKAAENAGMDFIWVGEGKPPPRIRGVEELLELG